MQQSIRHRTWLILGHYGGHNTGDEAMLLGFIRSCAPELRRRLVVVTKNGQLPSVFTDEDVQAIPAKIGPLWRALQQCEGIVWGGGTHFHDDYLRMRYLRHVRYLLRYLLIFTWGKLTRRKIVWLGMGFGPIWRKSTLLLLRWGLLSCDQVTVRDAISFQMVRDYLSPRQLTLTFDLAALLCESDFTFSQSDPNTIGVSVVEARASQTGKASIEQNFAQKFRDALANVYRRNSSLYVRVFVIRGGEREDDLGASQALVDALYAIDPARVALVPYTDDPARVFEQIAMCKGFIATRFHAAILSYLAGCRLLLLAYHRKLADLAQEIGLSDEACVDIKKPITTASLEASIQTLIADSFTNIPSLSPTNAVQRAQLNTEIFRSQL